jgi:hypothetical protein
MDFWADYLRDQAAMYRELAEQTDDPALKDELLELASVSEEVANNIEDRLSGRVVRRRGLPSLSAK